MQQPARRSAVDVDVNADAEGLQLLKDLQEVDDEMLRQHSSRVLRGCLVFSSYRSASWICAWIFEQQRKKVTTW